MGNRWGNSRNCQEFVFFFGSKITADDDCSHEIKRRLLLGRKVKTNLDSILKSRDITLPTKVCLVKAIFFFFLKGGTLLSVYLFIYLLYNIILVLPYINMHLPQVYTCSPSWTPLPPPSGSSQCTSHAPIDILSLTKEARIYNGEKTISLTNGNGEKTISLTNGAGKTGQQLVKEWN